MIDIHVQSLYHPTRARAYMRLVTQSIFKFFLLGHIPHFSNNSNHVSRRSDAER